MILNVRSCLLALFTLSLSAQQLPPAPKAHIVDITPKPGGYTEPAIAVNARDAKQLVVAWQGNASAGYSTDAGQNLTTAAGISLRVNKTSRDLAISFDATRHALLCLIPF